MMRKGLRSTSAGREKTVKKWKWTASKIVAFVVFGLFLLVIIFSEAFFSGSSKAPPENSYSPDQATYPSNDPNMDRYFDSIIRSSGQTVVSQLKRDSLQLEQINTDQPTPAVTNPVNQQPSTPNNNRPPRSQSSSTTTNGGGGGAAAVNQGTTSTNSGQLRLSDEGEIVEVTSTQSTEGTNSNTGSEDSGEAAEDSSIEEQFYTPVTVTGIITTSSDGTALSGVIISVNGTAISTKSGFDGKYAIAVPGNPQYRTLQFSYRGNTAERTVFPDTKVINIKF